MFWISFTWLVISVLRNKRKALLTRCKTAITFPVGGCLTWAQSAETITLSYWAPSVGLPENVIPSAG